MTDKLHHTIRLLNADDAACYALARRRMLTEHPENFGTSAEDEAPRTLADFAERLTPKQQPPEICMYGAFNAQAELQGLVGLSFNQRSKEAHKATVVSMYTVPEARGLGLGRQLLAHAIDAARADGRVDLLLLAVSDGNTAAEALYDSFGFVRYGVEPRAIRTGGRDIAKVLMALDLRTA